MERFYFLCKVDGLEYELKIKAKDKNEAILKFEKQTKKAKDMKLIDIFTEEQKKQIIKQNDKKIKGYYNSSSYHAQPNRRGKRNTRSVALWG